ncbi:TonB-dependent receptor plug domain-containing protein [Prolixibacteraceae bacterium Z1-6]|uniref:TonB-dependent receptor plug domain-containing protein n=1 Tax=Draconibacterium aestuarii TaxID=2998507 RepID=A0A9X3FDN5_9BACT|nr:TonB-dependent receptor plug domain-containing protein [Prolixibacteraceae bacterium Z1-6]
MTINTYHSKSPFLLWSFNFLLLVSFSFNTIAQTNYKTELNNIKQLEKSKTEKVYLHLDRTIFSPGEDIWFKAYLLEGTFHALTSTSNNLHIELISPEGEIVASQVTLIHNGVGNGDIHLKYKQLKDGIYEIRAYTNFMRNFNEALYFKKNVLLTSTSVTKTPEKEQGSGIDLQFFPEGGQLVQNVSNRVAFKATDEKGNGKHVKLIIFDDSGNPVRECESIHNGMGQFIFTPEPNKHYFATINSPESASIKIPLPESTLEYSILVGNQFNELLDFTISTSPENARGQQISYIIQSRGKLCSSNNLRMNEAQQLVRIEKKELPAGISYVTVYNENGVPVCERLIYNQISPKVEVNITTNKTQYDTREEVTLNITTLDEEGKPVPANLSLAVIGQSIIDNQKEILSNNASIRSSVLLCSDIKGQVENPDFYFENFDMKKHQLLDLVLLTHGWRKYIWKEKVDLPEFAMDFDYESGFTFTGTSKTLALKRPIPNSKVSLVMSDEGFYYDEVTADKNGRFMFENTHLMDTTTVVFQAYTKKDKRNTTIEIDEVRYDVPKTKPVAQTVQNSNKSDLNEIAEQAKKIRHIQDSLAAKNYKILDEVTIKAQKKRTLDDHFRLYHHPDEVIEITDKYAGYYNILDIVDQEIPSVQVYGVCPEVQVIIRGSRSLGNTLTANSNSSFLLDGMFVDVNDICNIPVTQVDKIEVLKGSSAAIFGSRAMNGIIAVYLKKANVKWEYFPIGINKIKPKGYYRAREFYSPNYKMAQEQFEGPDYRNTLYWEPFITTGKEGKAELSFFNSDDSGKYNITVEGVGFNGSIAKSEATFIVKTNNLSNK